MEEGKGGKTETTVIITIKIDLKKEKNDPEDKSENIRASHWF